MAASELLTRVAGAMLHEPDALVENLVAIITANLPELAPDPRVREMLATTVSDNVVSALRLVSSDSHEVADAAPPVALDFARRMAQQGVPITAMVRAYRLGQAAFQREAIERIAREEASAEEVATAAMALSSIAFSYIDKVSEDVVAAYQAERDAWLRHRNAARLAKVAEVLSGSISDAVAAETVLGYRLARPSVGAVLWCADASKVADPLASLERVVPALGTALGCAAQALSVAPDASTLWVWFPTGKVDVDAATATLTDGVLAAFGLPAEGLTGFRTSHLQARQGQAVALAAGGRPVTTTAQLGPLALLAADVSAAAAWVRSVLGSLADDDDAHARMRETAWAYLSSGGSLSAAATALHLHRNTIQYRIGKAEEERGRPFDDGRLDVEVALLACQVLGPVVLRPVDAS